MPSGPPDIPEPTLEQLLPTMYVSDREHCQDKTFPWAQREAIIEFYRKQWYERHRADAARRAGEAKVPEMDVPTPDKWLPVTPELAEYKIRERKIKEFNERQKEIHKQVEAQRRLRESTKKLTTEESEGEFPAPGSLYNAMRAVAEVGQRMALALSPDTAKELDVGDAMPPMEDSTKGAVQKTVSVKTFNSQAESDVNRSPAMARFHRDIERFRGHLEWFKEPLRIWWVLLSIFGIPYGCAVAAMFADQYIIAICLFLGASAVLAVKGIVEAKERERAILVFLLALAFYGAHVAWVIYTHKQITEQKQTERAK